MNKGKIIYSKRIKELLEDKYNIYPITRIISPRDARFTAWVFARSEELSFAIEEILNAKGENANDKRREAEIQ